MTSDELIDKMTSLLGGRAAEVLIFDKLSTGAADDLDKATDIARSMVTRYGMDKTLGLATYADEPSPYLGDIGVPRLQMHNYSEKTAAEIDKAVQELISEAFERASDILLHNRTMLQETAEKLLEEETLSGDELPTPIWERQDTPAPV
jgi:cell division protease FtsH